jgi:hypothetical protein
VAQINLEYYENLTDEMIDTLIADLRKQGAEDWKGGEYKRL